MRRARKIELMTIIFLIVVIFLAADWGFLRSEVTVYHALCKERVEYGICNTPEIPLRSTTYKVFPEKHEVLYWTQGFSPERLKDCVVKDLKNWRCTYDDGSASFGFTDGNHWKFASPPSVLTEKEYSVSKLEWLKLKIKSLF